MVGDDEGAGGENAVVPGWLRGGVFVVFAALFVGDGGEIGEKATVGRIGMFRSLRV